MIKIVKGPAPMHQYENFSMTASLVLSMTTTRNKNESEVGLKVDSGNVLTASFWISESD